MLHLALSDADANRLRSILGATLTDLRREMAPPDADAARLELGELASTIERILEQLVSEQGAPAEELYDDPTIPRAIGHFLREHGVSYAVIHHPLAYTAMREAAAAHIPGHEWAKAVVCIADDEPTLAVVPADHVIDRDRLRDLVCADQMRLATEAEIARLYWGCELGAVPPLGPLYGQRVFVDETLVGNDEIAFSAGSHRSAIRMRFRDFEALVRPTVGSFARTH